MHTEQVEPKTDIEWVHKIGRHVAAGDSLEEALAATVSFAVARVSCDFCSIYIRDGAELVLRVCNHSNQEEAKRAKSPFGQAYTAPLANYPVPVAVSTNGGEQFEARVFDQWSADPGETFVSIPLLVRKELVGAINLQHSLPRRYSLREVKLLSAVGSAGRAYRYLPARDQEFRPVAGTRNPEAGGTREGHPATQPWPE